MIQVRCINNNEYEEYLLINKIYEVINWGSTYYKILHDNKCGGLIINKDNFISLSEYRNQQIDKILK